MLKRLNMPLEESTLTAPVLRDAENAEPGG